MKKTKFLILISIPVMIIVGFLSCTKVMYKPSMQNVPLMENKGDFQSTISYNNYQVAYAASDKVAVMANGHYTSNI